MEDYQIKKVKHSSPSHVPPVHPVIQRALHSRHYILKQELTPEEKASLLNAWRDNHMAEFNSWVQLANCKVEYHYNEVHPVGHDPALHAYRKNELSQHIYQSTLLLSFPDYPELSTMEASAYGKNKKSSKKHVQETMTKRLMDMGLIRLGIKSKHLVVQQRHSGQEVGPKKQAKRLAKLIQEALLKEDFFTGCVLLLKVLSLKQGVEWVHVARLWQHALEKGMEAAQVVVHLLAGHGGVPYQVLEHMYEALLFHDEPKVQLGVADLLYISLPVVPQPFQSPLFSDYYLNKRNMMSVDLIESLHQSLQTENRVSLSGRLHLHGSRQEQLVVMFSSDEPREVLTQRVYVRAKAKHSDSYSMITEGVFVMLHCLGPSPFQIIACVTEVDQEYHCKLVLNHSSRLEQSIEQGLVFRMSKMFSRTPSDKTMDSVLRMCLGQRMSAFLQQTLFTPIQCQADVLRSMAKTHLHNHPPLDLPSLNHSQNHAVQSAMNQVLTLIQGPPGTGKTTTAVNIVRQWRLQSPSSKILVCADSNIAVDMLYQQFQLYSIRMVRLGQSEECSPVRSYSSGYSQLRQRLLSAEVVCTTCVGSASEFLQKQKFPRVLVDEATQATEMSTLIPLAKGCQQLVLIGDHKQLPPTVISQRAQSKGMGISLFERLVRQGIEPIILTTQYRMHPSLVVFPNMMFYNNMLLNGVDESQRPIIKGFHWPNPLVRLALVHTVGQEVTHSSSLMNHREISTVLSILKRVIQHDVIKMHQIGVITPYNAQKKKIKQVVNQEIQMYPGDFGLSQRQHSQSMVDVDTVDGYQGMERDLVIFSMVRSNQARSLGFVRDPRRFNVALTRAKRGLIIVGDTDTLCHDSALRAFIDWSRQHGCIVNNI